MIKVEIFNEPEAYGDIDITIHSITATLTAEDAATLADLLSQSLQDLRYEQNGRNVDNAYNIIAQEQPA